ncbi:endonuclease [Pontibacter harenae]|uniref:endonuclease n=1 Tax=Pontibacter harenae TaxID=2894083 RepID=UPI001E5460FD|nr:endonuclease [Pontibacter harenae]MCC9167358.1 endonuclease [Pontibacter harenae]
MKKSLLFLCWVLLSLQVTWAQTAPPSNLDNADLRAWLWQNWYEGKRQVLDYSTARGKMYNYIDNYNNKVTCVYSGYQEDKPYSETSTSTSVGIINCEHTVPQSWFDQAERMRTDIHHLFPTHTTWNADRGSDPFAEIPDHQTVKWIRGADWQSAIPASNIDEYSEDTNSQFEPREDHKGNLARSIFYFYTMHEGQSFDAGKGNISAVADINTLYQWHQQDPVDERERERNDRIQVAQGNRNPYIDYPDLVAKAWNLTPANCSPAAQLTGLTITEETTSSLKVSWTNGSGNARLVVVREGTAVELNPTGTYTGVSSNYSTATNQGNGERIVHSGGGNSVTITGLDANKTYHIKAFEFCTNGPDYNTANAPTATGTTPDYTCSGTPTAVADLSTSDITQTGFNLSWNNGSGDGRIVVIRKDAAVSFVPTDGTVYEGANANFALAAALTDGSKLVYSGNGSNVQVSGLAPGTTYYVQVFESCTNGNVYHTSAAPVATVTTEAMPSAGNAIVLQDFNGTASEGWEVTSGFSASAVNTGYPDGQRVRSGSSFQVSGSTKTIEFTSVDVSAFTDVYVELYNAAISVTAGNGMESSDAFDVYVAINGAEFSTVPDIKLTGDATDNNVRYGMNGTLTVATVAGAPVTKNFIKADGETGDLPLEKAPSKLKVALPAGATSVKLKLVIKANANNEVWTVDDVGLYGVSSATASDCDDNPIEDHAGEDKTVCVGTSVAIGAAAEAGYTYSWAPATGLSDASAANPSLTVTAAGSYTYTVTATNGTCEFQDEVTVVGQNAPAKPTITQTGNQLTANISGASYEWQLNGQALPNTSTQTITVAEAGEYRVRVANEQNCQSDFSEPLQVTLQPTAVSDELVAKGFKLYPNPSNGKLRIASAEALRKVRVVLYNGMGQVVYQSSFEVVQAQQELDLAHLPAGIYFVKVLTSDSSSTIKWILAK